MAVDAIARGRRLVVTVLAAARALEGEHRARAVEMTGETGELPVPLVRERGVRARRLLRRRWTRTVQRERRRTRPARRAPAPANRAPLGPANDPNNVSPAQYALSWFTTRSVLGAIRSCPDLIAFWICITIGGGGELRYGYVAKQIGDRRLEQRPVQERIVDAVRPVRVPGKGLAE